LCCFPQYPPPADWLAALLVGSQDAPKFLPQPLLLARYQRGKQWWFIALTPAPMDVQ